MSKWTASVLVALLAATVLIAAVVNSRGDGGAGVCACAHEDAILPAPGARDVPRNTKLWTIGAPQRFRGFEANGVPLVDVSSAELGSNAGQVWRETPEHLAARHTYVLRGYRGDLAQSFTTGDDDDTQPPAAPVVRALGLAVSEYPADPRDRWRTAPVTRLVFDGELDRDTVLLELTVSFERDGQTITQTLVTTRDGLAQAGRPACDTELMVPARGPVQLTVRAIDLAGNYSQPVVRDVEIWRAPPAQAACARQPVFHKTTADKVVEAIGLILLGLGALAALVTLCAAPVVLLIKLVSWLRQPRVAKPALPRATARPRR